MTQTFCFHLGIERLLVSRELRSEVLVLQARFNLVIEVLLVSRLEQQGVLKLERTLRFHLGIEVLLVSSKKLGYMWDEGFSFPSRNQGSFGFKDVASVPSHAGFYRFHLGIEVLLVSRSITGRTCSVIRFGFHLVIEVLLVSRSKPLTANHLYGIVSIS